MELVGWVGSSVSLVSLLVT